MFFKVYYADFVLALLLLLFSLHYLNYGMKMIRDKKVHYFFPLNIGLNFMGFLIGHEKAKNNFLKSFPPSHSVFWGFCALSGAVLYGISGLILLISLLT